MKTPDPKGANRQDINRAARALRAKPGWDPGRMAREEPLEQLRQLDQHSRDERVYTEAEVCAACIQARSSAGDDTALCDLHLRAALGM